MDPHLSYADPDPQNLMNTDPDPGQKNHQIDFKPYVKIKKKCFQICTQTTF